MYVSKNWSTTEWDCHHRSVAEGPDQNGNIVVFAKDNENGRLTTDNEKTASLFKVLDLLRDWNPGWVINVTKAGYKSGYRTPEVNAEVDGVPNSFHTQGFAADIHNANDDNATAGSLAKTIRDAARAYGLEDQMGLGEYSDGWCHVDFRGYAASWQE